MINLLDIEALRLWADQTEQSDRVGYPPSNGLDPEQARRIADFAEAALEHHKRVRALIEISNLGC